MSLLMNENLKINKNLYIGKDHPCFIIAEAGINHDGDVNKAKELVDVAVEAKADAVKFQMFDTNQYISNDAFLADYHKKGLIGKKEGLRGLLNRLEFSKEQYLEVYKYAKRKKFLFQYSF